jgi:ATP-dependent DNA helicase RecQ
MASAEEQNIGECIEKVLNSLSAIGCHIILKSEQRQAIENLLLGKDVIAILPTGFGKSMVFIVYVLAKFELVKLSQVNHGCSVLVVSPLKSIINDQISSVKELNCTAVELSDETFGDIVRSPPQFIYCTAENVIEEKFLDEIKRFNSVLHRNIAAVVVDESHTVQTWAGKRY